MIFIQDVPLTHIAKGVAACLAGYCGPAADTVKGE